MYKKSSQGWTKHLDFMVIDIFCLHIALILAFAIRHANFRMYQNREYLSIAVVLTLLDILISIVFNSFKNVLKRGHYRELVATVKHVCMLELGLTFYLFSVQQSEAYSRIVIYLFAPLYAGVTYLARELRKTALLKNMPYVGKRSLLIVTNQEMMKETVHSISSHNYERFNLTGMVIMDADYLGQTIEGVPVVANQENVLDYICRQWVDEVLIALPLNKGIPVELTDGLQEMGVVIHAMVAKAGDTDRGKQFVERLGNYTVLTTSLNYATPLQLMLKRGLDILGGLAGCLITLLLCITVGPVIYVKSPGPIFFCQTRVGKNGKKFTIYKFRTMYPDAEERKAELMAQNKIGDGMMFKLDFDPRIIGNEMRPDGSIKTGIGQFLRNTSLDEFPQMFNILKGDMSLVGTRPPTVDEWEKYKPHHRARLAIRPGLTGLWQVNGRSNITDFEEVVKLDTKYINEWNMGLDLKILLKTVMVVLRGDGAR